DQYLGRVERLDGTLRRRFTADLAARFAPRFPRRDADPEAFLVRLHTAEFEKRSGRLAARPTEGVGRTTVVAERFVTRKRDSWEAFRTLAARAERIGLKQLGAAEIPGFAARYREVAADLGGSRTRCWRGRGLASSIAPKGSAMRSSPRCTCRSSPRGSSRTTCKWRSWASRSGSPPGSVRCCCSCSTDCTSARCSGCSRTTDWPGGCSPSSPATACSSCRRSSSPGAPGCSWPGPCSLPET